MRRCGDVNDTKREGDLYGIPDGVDLWSLAQVDAQRLRYPACG